MYSTNLSVFEENLKNYIERREAFYRGIEKKSQKTLEEDLLSLRPKIILGYIPLFCDSDRSMKFHETSRELKKRVLSDKNKS